MVEEDKGPEKIFPRFSAIVHVEDKVTGSIYEGEIETAVNLIFSEFELHGTENQEDKLPIEIRIENLIIDPVSGGVEPAVILRNHNGERIIQILGKRVPQSGGKEYYSLNRPPYNLDDNYKATETDFRVILHELKVN